MLYYRPSYFLFKNILISLFYFRTQHIGNSVSKFTNLVQFYGLKTLPKQNDLQYLNWNKLFIYPYTLYSRLPRLWAIFVQKCSQGRL